MLTEDGFCVDCRTWVHEHPDVVCPNCREGKTPPAVVDTDDPVAMLKACRPRLTDLTASIVAAKQERRALARHILGDPELVVAARRAGVRLASLDRWAAPPAQKACRRGHATADWGDFDGNRWVCRKCAEEGPVREPTPNVPIATRKDRARVAASWREYEAQLAERERLAALDQVPAKLLPPMAPPSRPV